jgi:hypothetical protein
MTAADRLADVLTTALTAGAMPLAKATPRQPSTSVTPEEVTLIVEFRRLFADLMTGNANRASLAERFETLSAAMMALLRHNIPPIVVEVEQ